jgi:hypothetical protein
MARDFPKSINELARVRNKLTSELKKALTVYRDLEDHITAMKQSIAAIDSLTEFDKHVGQRERVEKYVAKLQKRLWNR